MELLKLPEPWKPCSCLLFTFFRCSEFTTSTIHVNSSRHACISDLSRFSGDTMVLYLKRTKTNRSSLPTPVFYSKVQSQRNPFETLVNFLQFRKSQSITITNPLFISESGQVATRFWFHHHFCHVLSLSGSLRVNYSRHSFRIGAATSAFCKGIPEHLMCFMGQTYHCYILSDLKDLRSAQSHLKWLEVLGGRSLPGCGGRFSTEFPHNTLKELEEPRSSTFSFLSFHNMHLVEGVVLATEWSIKKKSLIITIVCTVSSFTVEQFSESFGHIHIFSLPHGHCRWCGWNVNFWMLSHYKW